MSDPRRLYHFVGDKYGLENITNRHLKLAFSDQVNDLFELMPFDFGEGRSGRKLRSAWKQSIKTHALSQGFIAFSEKWCVPTMWAHYANNHKGICLGFDLPKRLKRGAVGEKIEYVRELCRMEQKVTEDTAYNAEMVKYARKTKSIHWQYEEEWRYWFSLTKSEKSEKSADPRKVFFTPFNDDLVLKEVVFGHRSELRQEKIKEILESSEGIKFTTARPSFREFAMVPQNRKDMQK